MNQRWVCQKAQSFLFRALLLATTLLLPNFPSWADPPPGIDDELDNETAPSSGSSLQRAKEQVEHEEYQEEKARQIERLRSQGAPRNLDRVRQIQIDTNPPVILEPSSRPEPFAPNSDLNPRVDDLIFGLDDEPAPHGGRRNLGSDSGTSETSRSSRGALGLAPHPPAGQAPDAFQPGGTAPKDKAGKTADSYLEQKGLNPSSAAGSVVKPYVVGTTLTDNQQGSFRFQYDTRHNRISIVDSAGNTTQFNYDATGRLIQITNPDGSTTRTTYDAAGRIVEVTNLVGEETLPPAGGAIVPGPIHVDTEPPVISEPSSRPEPFTPNSDLNPGIDDTATIPFEPPAEEPPIYSNLIPLPTPDPGFSAGGSGNVGGTQIGGNVSTGADGTSASGSASNETGSISLGGGGSPGSGVGVGGSANVGGTQVGGSLGVNPDGSTSVSGSASSGDSSASVSGGGSAPSGGAGDAGGEGADGDGSGGGKGDQKADDEYQDAIDQGMEILYGGMRPLPSGSDSQPGGTDLPPIPQPVGPLGPVPGTQAGPSPLDEAIQQLQNPPSTEQLQNAIDQAMEILYGGMVPLPTPDSPGGKTHPPTPDDLRKAADALAGKDPEMARFLRQQAEVMEAIGQQTQQAAPGPTPEQAIDEGMEILYGGMRVLPATGSDQGHVNVPPQVYWPVPYDVPLHGAGAADGTGAFTPGPDIHFEPTGPLPPTAHEPAHLQQTELIRMDLAGSSPQLGPVRVKASGPTQNFTHKDAPAGGKRSSPPPGEPPPYVPPPQEEPTEPPEDLLISNLIPLPTPDPGDTGLGGAGDAGGDGADEGGGETPPEEPPLLHMLGNLESQLATVAPLFESPEKPPPSGTRTLADVLKEGPPEGVPDEAKYDSGDWVYTDENGVRHRYNSQGMLMSQVVPGQDGAGSTVIHYGPGSVSIQQETADGWNVRTHYEVRDGQLVPKSSMMTRSGETYRYTYDENGKIIGNERVVDGQWRGQWDKEGNPTDGAGNPITPNFYNRLPDGRGEPPDPFQNNPQLRDLISKEIERAQTDPKSTNLAPLTPEPSKPPSTGPSPLGPFTVEPAGVQFNPPAPITIPNLSRDLQTDLFFGSGLDLLLPPTAGEPGVPDAGGVATLGGGGTNPQLDPQLDTGSALLTSAASVSPLGGGAPGGGGGPPAPNPALVALHNNFHTNQPVALAAFQANQTATHTASHAQQAADLAAFQGGQNTTHDNLHTQQDADHTNFHNLFPGGPGFRAQHGQFHAQQGQAHGDLHPQQAADLNAFQAGQQVAENALHTQQNADLTAFQAQQNVDHTNFHNANPGV